MINYTCSRVAVASNGGRCPTAPLLAMCTYRCPLQIWKRMAPHLRNEGCSFKGPEILSPMGTAPTRDAHKDNKRKGFQCSLFFACFAFVDTFCIFPLTTCLDRLMKCLINCYSYFIKWLHVLTVCLSNKLIRGTQSDPEMVMKGHAIESPMGTVSPRCSQEQQAKTVLILVTITSHWIFDWSNSVCACTPELEYARNRTTM